MSLNYKIAMTLTWLAHRTTHSSNADLYYSITAAINRITRFNISRRACDSTISTQALFTVFSSPHLIVNPCTICCIAGLCDVIR